ncbi:hypothetical protein AX16_000650 [Volvariella volvacea WC 439]|nr:hypothetical protein AX16_000650 [Volvariella volvacea WC 439]
MDIPLHNRRFFPSLEELPDDNDPNYYSTNDDGKLVPTRHWCLLSEIFKVGAEWPFRPSFFSEDVSEREHVVGFYVHQKHFLNIRSHCKPGCTMAFMYAKKHQFTDGQIGIKAEEMTHFTVFPCTLKELLSLEDKLKKNAVCAACGNAGKQKCSRCGIAYCSKDCQVSDWGASHKRLCPAAKMLGKWANVDWDNFQNYLTLELD